MWRMLDYLDSVERGANQPLAESLKQFCLRNSGKGIVVLISDLMDKAGYQSAAPLLDGPGYGRVRDPGSCRRRRSIPMSKGT